MKKVVDLRRELHITDYLYSEHGYAGYPYESFSPVIGEPQSTDAGLSSYQDLGPSQPFFTRPTQQTTPGWYPHEHVPDSTLAGTVEAEQEGLFGVEQHVLRDRPTENLPVYLWNVSEGFTFELVTVEDDLGPVTSGNWAPDGQHLAIGWNNSEVQLLDSSSSQLLRTLKKIHRSRFGTLAWNNNILTICGIGNAFITDVQMLDEKSIDKANPTPCSQAARHDVANDFGQLSVDDFIAEIVEGDRFTVEKNFSSIYCGDVYEDEMTEEFDLKLWVCVSKNFDVKSHWGHHVPKGWEKALPTYTPESNVDATRNLSQQCLHALATILLDFLGRSADLTSSNMTLLQSFGDFQKATQEERNIENKIFDAGIFVLIAQIRSELLSFLSCEHTLQAAATAFCKDVPKRELGPSSQEFKDEHCQEDRSKILCPSSLQMSAEPSELAVQDGIVPLLGKPYFTSIVSERHIRDFILKFPSSFHHFLPSSSTLVVLYCRSNEWVVKCCVYDHKKQLENGWEKFAVDNNLRIGDGCVFELMNFKESYPLKFKVQILDGQIPQTTQVGVADLPSAD
ncbi:hypothetical protein KFK09_018543 [Dendrobium nobile]|uniref:TF-B3 domain-containing protein n=1 Tax=Dendrobium nobile TaxID=94219 RepID=A0A8T3AW47_DENNO|nr:hypothetical protein KFK09_018543 [Dendrobium nobile]